MPKYKKIGIGAIFSLLTILAGVIGAAITLGTERGTIQEKVINNEKEIILLRGNLENTLANILSKIDNIDQTISSIQIDVAVLKNKN